MYGTYTYKNNYGTQHTSLDLSKCLYKHSCTEVGLQNITLSTTKTYFKGSDCDRYHTTTHPQ